MSTSLPIYQIDAFAKQRFQGNPAAVVPLTHWLSDELLQAIAQENNLSETAFYLRNGEQYQLRWFTPAAEVDLCGHATLAAAEVIFNYSDHTEDSITFSSRSGPLTVTKTAQGMLMDFPATQPEEIKAPAHLLAPDVQGVVEVVAGFDYIIVMENEQQVVDFQPDFLAWRQLDLRGVVITAPGEQNDFVSRCFFPKLDVNEDPVTGSAHCQLAPYWAKKLAKTHLNAKQLSERSGEVICQIKEQRVELIGQCVAYLKGEISI
ncbi:hypothetical protein tinsulaeT_05930 [Thalassotalea insulae]|uniref:PhzF family phenazine biosynthesis protein n=1 Tax=Thalassotalea insulae TaxID=2056778 RepID=A0ABQ6GMN5_9GAMM|nr:PhzF family phenazine biosynthesis protein [Thalassotalea insulae]GLX77253.1 hypothetical protein tinsulaeT_05930 [Thalassotalea insulae]